MKQLILIGGSAGSLDVLLQLLPALKASFSIPIVIVLHRKPASDTTLTSLLATRSPLHVKEVEEKEFITAGTIYIAPPDYHLLIEKDHSFSLDDSEKVNYSRPSIDVSFQSAADVFGPELLCILLSGANSDGTEGFRYVRQKGGMTIAQDPSSADVAYMPQQAILSHMACEVMDVPALIQFLNELPDKLG